MKKILVIIYQNIKEVIIRLLPIILVITVAVVCSLIGRPSKDIIDNKRDTIVTELKDSIKHLKIKENEEIDIIRRANNDSTIIIFKQLIAE